MGRSVHLDREPDLWEEEIDDPLPAYDVLALELAPQRPAV
jgi:hypothetical protein